MQQIFGLSRTKAEWDKGGLVDIKEDYRLTSHLEE